MSGGGERTEQATPKKRSDARKKGNLLRSTDVGTSLQLLGFAAAFGFIASWTGQSLRQLIVTTLQNWVPQKEALTILMVQMAGHATVLAMVRTLAPIFVFALATAVAVQSAQTRFFFSTEMLAVKPERINPLKGFKRIFSGRAMAELIKASAKIVVVAAVIWPPVRDSLARIAHLLSYDIRTASGLVQVLVRDVALRCAVVLIVIAAADFGYQWWRHERDLRMTKQEVKDEFKQMEGNPQTKGRIRQIQRQMAARRMMQAVPKASVIIANPTHFAVALRYKPGEDTAPVMLAKGQDLVALRIRELAAAHRIPVVENKPLARTLFSACEIGRQIPVGLYGAVAEVLAFVAKLKEGRRP
jgi:flagellar biosynthesis protein FlhB